MSAQARPDRAPGAVATFITTVRAIVTRELRWRMRGKRPFVIAMAAILLLGLVVFGIHQLMIQSAIDDSRWRLVGFDGTGPILDTESFPLEAVSGEAAARIGQAIFGGVLGVLTALTLLVAPALAAGVISSEREKQTLELLVTSPVSTLGVVIGKLVASLGYVLLLLVASIPLMGIVFAFGGVAPDAVVRAYLAVLAMAFGSAAIGLFLSALLGRTQVATVVSYLILFGLVVGTLALYLYLAASNADDLGMAPRQRAPEVLLLLNPLITDVDVMCNALPETRVFCSVIAQVRGISDDPRTMPADVFWPRSVAAFVVLGVGLIILSTQFISPSRRWRIGRRPRVPPPPPQDAGEPGPLA